MNSNPTITITILSLALSLASGGLVAQSPVTIPASKDNTLYEDQLGSLSNGQGVRCFTGVASRTQLKRRAVMAFAIGARIPRFSTITKVDLVLTVVQSNAVAPQPITLHALTADWGEGTSVAGGGIGPGSGGGGGTSSTTNDATWIHRFFSNSTWQNAGGDFNATPTGSASVGGLGKYTWASTPAMVAEVQGWLDQPGTNFGWLLLGDVSAWGFATREEPIAADQPQLIVSYTPPSAAVTSIGTGCNGSGANPLLLTANGRPTVPSASFSLSLTGGPTGTTLFGLAFGTFPNGVPLGGGCSLYVNPSPVFLVFNAPASRTLPSPIPAQTSLLGLEGYWQGAVGDASTSQLVTSNALTTRLGL